MKKSSHHLFVKKYCIELLFRIQSTGWISTSLWHFCLSTGQFELSPSLLRYLIYQFQSPSSSSHHCLIFVSWTNIDHTEKAAILQKPIKLCRQMQLIYDIFLTLTISRYGSSKKSSTLSGSPHHQQFWLSSKEKKPRNLPPIMSTASLFQDQKRSKCNVHGTTINFTIMLALSNCVLAVLLCFSMLYTSKNFCFTTNDCQ